MKEINNFVKLLNKKKPLSSEETMLMEALMTLANDVEVLKDKVRKLEEITDPHLR